jgi:hypothetical protein
MRASFTSMQLLLFFIGTEVSAQMLSMTSTEHTTLNAGIFHSPRDPIYTPALPFFMAGLSLFKYIPMNIKLGFIIGKKAYNDPVGTQRRRDQYGSHPDLTFSGPKLM